jgi:phosphoglycolate phosphatase
MSQLLKGYTIVFDLDGTLIDTAPDLLQALNRVLDLEGLKHPPEIVARNFVGHGARALIAKAADYCGAHYNDEKLDELTSAYIDFYRADIASFSRPFPGVIDAMDELEADGAIFAVCTNKRTDLSVQLLDALTLSSRFLAIVGADSVTANKPDAQHYLETISRAGGEAARSLMVGDSITDASTARNAGVPVILSRLGYSADIDKIDCDGLISGFEELAAMTRRLLA